MPQSNDQMDRISHAQLLTMANTASTVEQAWLLLEAAHIVGQSYLQLHLQTHAQMLKLAIHHRNWPEALGQVFRLLLVPLGHLTGRLPIGNPGRSTVSAFAPLPVRPELAELIARVQAARVRDH